MAPEYWLNSHRSRLSLSLLCLFAASLQVTSGWPGDAQDGGSFSVTQPPPPPPHPFPPSPSPPLSPTKPPKCDQTFVSNGEEENGTFSAPELVNPHNQSRQCLFTFLAAPGQRVELSFSAFNLRGKPQDGAAVGELPGCVHEYMDVYSEAVSGEAGELVTSPFGGRYCGPIPPRRRVSLHKAVALSFFTDKPYTPPALFHGVYRFINDSEYWVGTAVDPQPCSFTIQESKRRKGVLLSPTYPGAYPKGLHCAYSFIGKPGQRVRIEFRDFDLFYGGPHCPFDYVRVFDGPDNTSAQVGTYCGQQRNLVLYSSDERLLVVFYTLPRAANTQNRGFKGMFEFSESFVKLDFISKKDAEHIRGSECDQKILSKKESTGYVFSPNYPFPYIPKIVCRYFIYGMQDSQHLERVRLEFSKFDLPKQEPKPDKPNETGAACTDGYLKVYLKGQEASDSYDKFDMDLCGDTTPPSAVSDGPRLVLVFSSGELWGRGFKAKYSFETEYRIPGTAAPDGTCSFTYKSSSRKKGEFNSPRYPSNYPSDTNCTYMFQATPNEQVTIVFDHFKVKADSVNTTKGAYGSSICYEDWVEVWGVTRSEWAPLGRYCGLTAPGPLISPRGAIGLAVQLHSDSEGVASGFKARYTFEVAKSIFGDCGGNMSGMEYGVITSPNFPSNYDGPGRGLASKTCNWFVSVKPQHKILLNFEFFAVEGEPAGRGCSAAVLRLWYENSGPPVELCGEMTTDKWQYITEGNTLRLTFISSDKSVGAQGWRAVWTEVRDMSEGGSCEQFMCQKSRMCISNKLVCNRVQNCGADDKSDEAHCPALGTADSIGGEERWWSWVGGGSGGGGGSGSGGALASSSLWWWCGAAAACIACATAWALLGRRQRRRRRRGPLLAPPPPPRPPPPPPPPAAPRSPPPPPHCDPCGERLANADTV